MKISTHVLDTSIGRPAASVAVRLERQSGTVWTEIGRTIADVDGRASGLGDSAEGLAGSYRLIFGVGDYFRSRDLESFYADVTVEFVVRDAAARHHVPLLLNPYGYSTYPGGADAQAPSDCDRELQIVIFNLSEWLNLLTRWVHVFSAILWVGSTYYFTWLDGQMRKMERQSAGGGAVWMVHSGGFYTVVKQKTLGVPPGEVHWFRYEALATFISGFVLLNLVYYHGGLIVDPIDPRVTPIVGGMIGVATLVAGWIAYDLLVRTPLVRHDAAFAAVAFILIMATTVLLSRWISTRATYIHIGALFGTIMVLNVWMRILPPQRRMIAAAAQGEPFDGALAAGAKERSKHNTFLAVPTTFVMISNHFPTATYGNYYAAAVLGVLILAGWGAAALLRRA